MTYMGTGNDEELDDQQQHQLADDVQAVHVVMDNYERERAADFCNWITFTFTGTEAVPVQVLPYNPKRKRATIYCLPGFTSNNTLGFVNVASRRDQVQAGGAKSGGMMVSGMAIVIESMDAVYAMPDGSHELTIMATEERYK